MPNAEAGVLAHLRTLAVPVLAAAGLLLAPLDAAPLQEQETGASAVPIAAPAAASPVAVQPAAAAIEELRVDVGGASVRALCTGGDAREVVLLHDEHSSADAWLPVLESLDGRAGACAYDRIGSGESGPPPQERGWYEFVDELRRIHLALGFTPRYVVAGHGVGGLYGRMYVLDRPNDLSGLVLVDPAHEDLPQRVRAGMPRDEWSAWMEARGRANEDGVVETRLADRARGSRLPQIRVTVLTAAVRADGDGWDARFVGEASRTVHADIVRGLRMGRHIPASRSGHDVLRDQPRLVADEIFRVARATRR